MPSRTARAVLPVVLALSGLACGPAPTSPRAEAEAGPSPDSSPDSSPDPSPDSSPAPQIASDEPTFEFGTVAPGKSVTHVFTLVNRGSADLHIERVERT